MDSAQGSDIPHGLGGPVLVIASPHAGHAATAPDALLRAAGLTVADVLPVSALDNNLPQGARWREQGIAAVVAAGGDGTLGAVATQVAGTGLPMGILPLGTSNDSARSLDIPIDPAEAAHVIAEGVPTELDVGIALPALTAPHALSPETGAGSASGGGIPSRAALAAHGAYFLHALTLGLNVEFARLATDVANRARWGNLTYAASALEAVSHFQPVPVTLRLSGVQRNGNGGNSHAGEPATASAVKVVSCRAVQVAVVNLPVFGGALNLRLPDSASRDRLLDFVIIEALDPHPLRDTVEKLITALGHLRDSLFAGANHGISHADTSDEAAGLVLPGVHRYRASEAVVETPEGVDVTLDGEIRARTPVLVRIAPDSVRVLLKPGSQQATQPASP